jgi:proline iminopeptidase
MPAASPPLLRSFVLAHRAVRPARRGRSTPCAEIVDNTTAHLVADLERLRQHLGIERWLLFGGSWGSTLALAYAEAYPQRCLGLVLRGIFLARPSELDWFMHGMRYVFPEAWRAFSEFLPPAERSDLLGSYYRRLTHPDRNVHMPAAQAWDRYEGACSKLLPPTDPLPKFDSDASSLAIARIEAHYFVHRAFLQPNEILANIGRIRHLPCTIVQGRYDVICPPVTADALARAWPGSRVPHRPGRRPFGPRARDHPGAGRRGKADAAEGRALARACPAPALRASSPVLRAFLASC